MAYGLILTGGTPDSVSSMRQFIDQVSQNFRKLEVTFNGGATKTVSFTDAAGNVHTVNIATGIITSWDIAGP